ncbi:hypothetical protein ACFXB3_04350 [Streptomyces sp. NPDC059447]|uniref:hypothetical protein n=1 Tax=unclassified Streptomyces TaxID=2593676 RepID=UPI0036819BEE
MTDRPKDSRDPLAFPCAERLRAAGEVAPPGPAVLEAALSAVRAAAAAEEREAAPGVVRLRPRRVVPRSRKLLVSALAIAAIAAGVSVYPVAGLEGSPPAARAGAAEFLRQVAATEAKGTAVDAPYWKVHMLEADWGRKPSEPEPSYSETPEVNDLTIWRSADAVFFQHGTDGEIVRTPRGGKDWIKVLPGTRIDGLSWEEVKRLPTDAAELKVLLERFFPGGPGPDREAAQFEAYRGTLDYLLMFAPLEPRQRAAVYEVLADMPGLRLIGPVKDSSGRTGTAVETDIRGLRMRLIIDPEGGALLEHTLHYLGGAYDGKLAHRTTFMSSGPEQSIPPYRETSGKGLEQPQESKPAS